MMGCTNAELWNNLGLCCFYASQYDMTVRCFENALMVADDLAQADIWYDSFTSRNALYQRSS
jgi:tetratricopeptide repeat protein 8